MDLDDQAFLARFEQRDLTAEDFDHRGHLRMAWLHLRRFGREEATIRLCNGIHELATRLGAPEKFNHTLTEALVRIMARRMRKNPCRRFRAFLDANSDLVADARGLLARYYSDDVLYSARARKGWVEPDRAPIE